MARWGFPKRFDCVYADGSVIGDAKYFDECPPQILSVGHKRSALTLSLKSMDTSQLKSISGL